MSIGLSRRSCVMGVAWLVIMAAAMSVLTVLVPRQDPSTGIPFTPTKRTKSAAEFSFPPEPTVRDHTWRAAAVELTEPGARTDFEGYHFVISAGGEGYEPITSVRTLWRQQLPSPVQPNGESLDPDGTVRIALLSGDTGGPSPQQWEALGLLLRQLHQRHGVTVVGLDDRLRADPNATGLRIAAAW